jgi:hypothetical protein
LRCLRIESSFLAGAIYLIEVLDMDQSDGQTDMFSALRELRERTPYEEPLGDLEIAIAQVWADTLKLPRVGRNDNFFELGGNSLIGMDLTEILASRHAIEVPVVALFQNPTVRDLAQSISDEARMAV